MKLTKRTRKAHGRLPVDAAFLAPIITGLFAELNVGAAFHTAETARVFEEWYPLHSGPSTLSFEIEHGADTRRWRHNAEGFARAHQEKNPVLTEHAGFWDAFVPVGEISGVPSTLVVGSFSKARPTSSEVHLRWQKITGGQGRLGDPAFAQYLSSTLDTLTLESERLDDFRRMLACFARLFAPESEAAAVAREVEALRPRLALARSAERMWEAARSMIDDRSARGWRTADRTQELTRLGVQRPPEHVIVGLLVGRTNELDAVDEVVRRDAFQRACTALARKRGGIVCGRLGNHGVALLVEHSSRNARALEELADQAIKLGRQFDLRLHAGLSSEAEGAPSSLSYQMALAAAELALAKNVGFLRAGTARETRTRPLGELRRQLGRASSERPGSLSALFQRYIEAASVRSGYRLEALHAHLDAGFDELLDALSTSRALDEKSLADLRQSIDREANAADTVSELSEVFRRAVTDAERALLHPTDARHEQGFRRALAYIRDHLGERLTRAKVARVAGFSQHYFSKRFTQSEGVTFQEYLRTLRLERAKELLRTTTLNVERVAQLSGFGNRIQFHRTFKQSVRATPLEYRLRPNRYIKSHD